jgi:hypothetical protein
LDEWLWPKKTRLQLRLDLVVDAFVLNMKKSTHKVAIVCHQTIAEFEHIHTFLPCLLRSSDRVYNMTINSISDIESEVGKQADRQEGAK